MIFFSTDCCRIICIQYYESKQINHPFNPKDAVFPKTLRLFSLKKRKDNGQETIMGTILEWMTGDDHNQSCTESIPTGLTPAVVSQLYMGRKFLFHVLMQSHFVAHMGKICFFRADSVYQLQSLLQCLV